MVFTLYIFGVLCVFCFLGAHLQHMEVPSQVRGLAAGLHGSHSNTGSVWTASVTHTTAHGVNPLNEAGD